MKFDDKAQEEAYGRVVALLKEMSQGEVKLHPDHPIVWFRDGSATAMVAVEPWRDDEAMVRVSSWVVSGAELVPDLMKFLLQKNFEMLFGAFNTDPDGDIFFKCNLAGSTVDKDELRHAIGSVLVTANRFDDEIVAKWGGQTAKDRM